MTILRLNLCSLLILSVLFGTNCTVRVARQKAFAKPVKPGVQADSWSQRTYNPNDERLEKAVAAGNLESIKSALKDGANPNSHLYWHSLLTQGPDKLEQRLAIAKVLLDHGADINGKTYEYDSTPLGHEAMNYGDHIEYIQFLLDHGADANMPGSENKTPLHIAVGNRNLKVVQLLLARGANPSSIATWPPAKFDMPYRQEDPVTQYGLAHRYDSRVRWYIDRPPLFELVGNWSEDIANALVKAGADFKQLDGFGMNALHYAVLRQDIKSIEALIARGLDIDSQTKMGSTPLHLAVINLREHFESSSPEVHVIATLLNHRADKTKKNMLGQTPFDLLLADSKEIQYRYKAYPGLRADNLAEYKKTAEQAKLILNPSGRHLIEPILARGPDGIIYGPIGLGQIKPRWPEYDYPHPGFTSGPPRYPDDELVSADRAITTRGGKTILTLTFTGTVLESVTMQLKELQLAYWETTTKLPLTLKLKKGVPQKLRFEFPLEAAWGNAALKIVDEVTDLSSTKNYYGERTSDYVNETAPLDEIFKFDATEKDVTSKPAYLLHNIKGRVVLLEFTHISNGGKEMTQLIGRQFRCEAGKKVILPGTRSNAGFNVGLRARILPNKEWEAQAFSAG